jgi:hypothetical protein
MNPLWSQRHPEPRENSLLPTFPYGYRFTGTDAEAVKQTGNALPPCMAEALYRSCTRTLKALDLNHYLATKGFTIPQRAATHTGLFASLSVLTI